MGELVSNNKAIRIMPEEAVAKVRMFEEFALQFPQVEISTEHLFHAGMYARTIMVPAETILTGALIEVDTMLIIQGDVKIFVGNGIIELTGYNVLAASKGRKQAFHAKTDTYITMIFPTAAKNVEEAENEFTNEAHMLISRNEQSDNHVVITGE